MEALLVYLLKAHVVLALFAVAYYGLLRRLTFFRLNRWYLLVALVFAAVYPAVPMPGLLPAEAPAPTAVTWVLADLPGAASAVAAPVASGPDWPALVLWLYGLGVAVLLGRLLVQLLALARLRRAAQPARTPAGVAYRELPGPGDPFSFGRTIYLHAAQHPAHELGVVVAHEQAHVRQGHTLDVLLAHLGTALFWPSPAVWLLRRAVLDNLEYLADEATLRTGLDRRTYQYCLLQLSQGAAGPALALPFTFFTLKNRVAMMNTPISSNGQLARYFLAGPLVVLAALGYSAAHAREAVPAEAIGAESALLNKANDELLNKEHPTARLPLLAAASNAQTTSKAHTAATMMPAAVRRYLASAYPQGIIKEVLKGRLTPAGPTNYIVTIAQRQQTRHPFFSADGQFLGELKNKYQLYQPAAFTPTTPQKLVGSQPIASSPQNSPLYYLNGEVITETQYRGLKPADIASINVLKDEPARQLAGDKGGNCIIIITTEASKNEPAVLAFNQRVQRIAPGPAKAAVASSELPANMVYYVDGQQVDKETLDRIDPATMVESVNVLKANQTQQLLGLDAPAVLVTTKANAQSPEVLAFNQKAAPASNFTQEPVKVNVLVPKALSYITSHYPDARLGGEVTKLTDKETGAVKYRVQLVKGRRPFDVYFSPQGDFMGE
jgi:hypothetical protein